MTQKIEFTFYLHHWIFDISEFFEGDELEQQSKVIKLKDILKREARVRSEKKKEEINKEILELLDLKLTVDIDPGDLFNKNIKVLEFPITTENSRLSVSIDEDSYELDGDIIFQLEATKDLTFEIVEEWEQSSGYVQPNLLWSLGDYAADSGGSLSWEILES